MTPTNFHSAVELVNPAQQITCILQFIEMEVKFERDENLAIYPPNWDTILDQFLHPPDPTFSTKDLELSKKLQLEPYPSIGELSILAKIAYSSYEDAKEELKCKLYLQLQYVIYIFNAAIFYLTLKFNFLRTCTCVDVSKLCLYVAVIAKYMHMYIYVHAWYKMESTKLVAYQDRNSKANIHVRSPTVRDLT